jgi:hypothetical protein
MYESEDEHEHNYEVQDQDKTLKEMIYQVYVRFVHAIDSGKFWRRYKTTLMIRPGYLDFMHGNCITFNPQPQEREAGVYYVEIIV